MTDKTYYVIISWVNTKQNHASSRLARTRSFIFKRKWEEMRRLKRAYGLQDLAVNYTNLHKKLTFALNCLWNIASYRYCAFVSCGKRNYWKVVREITSQKIKQRKEKENLVHWTFRIFIAMLPNWWLWVKLSEV